jgi:hypothetical protein
MIVMVFDPLAVLMLVAANWNMKRDQELIQPETPEPITIPPTPLPEESKSIIKDFFKPKEAKVETHHHATTKHIIELEDGVMVDDMAHVEHLPEKPPRQPLR